MRGQSLTYVAGGDRTVPFHVPYSEPKKRPTGLDWASLNPEPTTPAEVIEAKPTCNHCRRHVDVVSRFTGMCPDCERELDPHHQESPSTPQEITMPTPDATSEPRELPLYAVLIAELLDDTEGHPDPLVRAVRKIVTQSALALKQAHEAASQTSGPDATATAHPIEKTTESTSSSGSEGTTSKTNGSAIAAARIRELGTTPAEIRAWALTAGVPCTPKGTVPGAVVDAYTAAHPTH